MKGKTLHHSLKDKKKEYADEIIESLLYLSVILTLFQKGSPFLHWNLPHDYIYLIQNILFEQLEDSLFTVPIFHASETVFKLTEHFFHIGIDALGL
jgi:hypothetical protein